MKVSVVFPSVVYREGPQAVTRLIRGIESIGYDQLDMFDHVLMGYPTISRKAPFYPSKMPIMEALMTLSYAAAVTETIGLGTGVLVLPQRQPALVAKQVSTLDTLSGGRVRLGIGVGWQESEYVALEEDFHNRGARMDEAINLLRSYWGDERIDIDGDFYHADAMAMEPKPIQGRNIPIWIGGAVSQTLRRAGELGDGWMGQFVKDDATARNLMQKIRGYAEAAGRDPAAISMQLSLTPARGEDEKFFYSQPARLRDRLVELRDLGFDWTSINTVPIFQAGHRSVDAMLEHLAEIYETIKPELNRT
ncbi:MAG: LLM class F420-dependent oxidoreductase [bacterium]|nr:LLM class F420-dependent oxidoreductase [Gammaproteobacteria bacterium]